MFNIPGLPSDLWAQGLLWPRQMHMVVCTCVQVHVAVGICVQEHAVVDPRGQERTAVRT